MQSVLNVEIKRKIASTDEISQLHCVSPLTFKLFAILQILMR